MAPLTDPDAINARLDGVSLLIANPGLSEKLRRALKGVADMPRALSRLALNRGGPRDLGAILAGLKAATDIAALFGDGETPAHLRTAVHALSAVPGEIGARLAATLDDELPLMKRDGGFVRAGHSAELDELRALRDQSRRVIAGLQLSYAEETGVRSLKIKHNNVLGYFIEVTALNAGPLTEGDEAKAKFIHRQTMANAMRFTTTELRISKPASPMRRARRWPSSLPPLTSWCDGGRPADAIKAAADGAVGHRRDGSARRARPGSRLVPPEGG
jgi:DNA mismatch repair protein MutS